MQMKVTQVLYSGKGGHGSVAHSLIRADKEAEFEHNLIYFGIEKMDPDYEAFCDKQQINFIAIQKKQGKHLKSWRMFLKALKHQNPDSIMLHSLTLVWPTIWYCFFHKAKLIVVEHQSNQFKRTSEWIWSFLALIFAKSVVYLTKSYHDEMRLKFGFLARKKKIFIIPNGIDTDFFVPGNALQDGKIRIGMASRINSMRDHQTLVNAFGILSENHPEIELHIAGTGDGMEKLEKLVAGSNDRDFIFLHGNLSESELLVFLQNLDIYVHVTLAETLSTALLQAMSVGLPVVVSRIPGTQELIEDYKDGLFFDPKNATQLSDRVGLILNEKALGNAIAQEARKKAVSCYGHQGMFNKYRELLS